MAKVVKQTLAESIDRMKILAGIMEGPRAMQGSYDGQPNDDGEYDQDGGYDQDYDEDRYPPYDYEDQEDQDDYVYKNDDIDANGFDTTEINKLCSTYFDDGKISSPENPQIKDEHARYAIYGKMRKIGSGPGPSARLLISITPDLIMFNYKRDEDEHASSTSWHGDATKNFNDVIRSFINHINRMNLSQVSVNDARDRLDGFM